jgi:hypothetical protein
MTRAVALAFSLVALIVDAFLTGCASSGPRVVRGPSWNEELRQELLVLCETDQKLRAKFGPRMHPDQRGLIILFDEQHTERMKEIVAEHGWPGRSLVGEEGAHAAWLLVQHADAAFMAHCLPLLERAVYAGEAAAKDYAYLLDRVRMNQGRPQVYGSQFKSGPDGKLVLHPIEDAAHVDERRRALGMEPLADYERTLRKAFAR